MGKVTDGIITRGELIDVACAIVLGLVIGLIIGCVI